MSGSGAVALPPRVLRRERPLRIALRGRGAAVLVALLLVAAAATAVLLGGVRFFVVQTPSMGTAAPVGSLVIDVPARLDRLAVGDIISFHPPGVIGTTYTHRIVGISAGLVETRGDINGAADPWRVSDAEIVGRAVALIPGAGWVVKALPLLLIGGGVVWGATLLARTRVVRSGLRVLGGAVLAAAAVVVLKPLASVEVLTTSRVGSGTAVTFVSTGLLPVSVHPSSGPGSIRLSAGEVGSLVVDHGAATGGFRMVTNVAPDPLQWALLVVACSLPMLWVLAFGLADDDGVVP